MAAASQVKQTLTSLKGAQATLRLYSAQVRDGETESVYNQALNMTNEVIQDLEVRVQVLEYQGNTTQEKN